ncbi:MAG: S1 RNA-binding domain-containing protein [Sphingobacteriaceae bacterium]
MLHIGKTNTLTILRNTSVGMYLSDNENAEILLPKKYIHPEFQIGDDIDVFVYKDSEDRLIATTLKPYAQVGEFANLKAVSVSRIGAFLDWGLEKDLLVPFKEQRHKMFEGFSYVVYVYLDEITERVVATSKFNKFLDTDTISVTQGEEVDLLVYDESPLGFNCIINNKHRGLIYSNDVYQDIQPGDKLKGYVKLIRPDKLIDLSLQPIGFKNVLSSTDLILNYLKENNGFMALTDKSSPEEIERIFKMSKATFKKSIGVLYRQRKVRLESDGVYLASPEG